MPNWCNNRVVVRGSKDKIVDLKNKIEETGKLLTHLHPMPKGLEDTTSPSDGPNWYDWCMENWGTKWDVSDMDILFYDDRVLELKFLTAWSPPLNAFKYFTNKSKDVTFSCKWVDEEDLHLDQPPVHEWSSDQDLPKWATEHSTEHLKNFFKIDLKKNKAKPIS